MKRTAVIGLAMAVMMITAAATGCGAQMTGTGTASDQSLSSGDMTSLLTSEAASEAGSEPHAEPDTCYTHFNSSDSSDTIPIGQAGQVNASSDKVSSQSSAQNVQELSKKLMKELGTKKAAKLTFYDVANKRSFSGYKPIENIKQYADGSIQPCAELKGAEEIAAFQKSLQLDQWQPKNTGLKSLPKMHIYFDGDLHINLEAQTDKSITQESWMSINSPSGSVTYIVPNEVYNTLWETYRE